MKKERGLYRRRRSPYWWITYSGKHGNMVRESTGVKEKSLAREILDKRRTEVAEGTFMKKEKQPKVTMEELCEQYWNAKGCTLKFKGLDSMIKQWKKFFGKKKVSALKQEDIELYMKPLKEKSPYTHNNHLNMLRVLFNWGIAAGKVKENPAAKVVKMKTVHRTRYLTVEEVQKLLKACNDQIRSIVEFAVNTGLRKGEIFDLKWTDVNMEQCVIWIHTSEKGAPRHVPMNDRVREILDNLPRKSLYVFSSRIKRCSKITDIKKAFRTAVEKAKIEDFRFHDLRHTFASHLVMAGVPLKAVSELLGHSTLKMTEKYAHLAPGYKQEQVKVLDEVFKQKPNLKIVRSGKS